MIKAECYSVLCKFLAYRVEKDIKFYEPNLLIDRAQATNLMELTRQLVLYEGLQDLHELFFGSQAPPQLRVKKKDVTFFRDQTVETMNTAWKKLMPSTVPRVSCNLSTENKYVDYELPKVGSRLSLMF